MDFSSLESPLARVYKREFGVMHPALTKTTSNSCETPSFPVSIRGPDEQPDNYLFV